MVLSTELNFIQVPRCGAYVLRAHDVVELFLGTSCVELAVIFIIRPCTCHGAIKVFQQ